MTVPASSLQHILSILLQSSTQVRHVVDGHTIKREAIVPLACLMNHAAAAPHVRQFGQLQGGWLHFPANRAISAGDEVPRFVTLNRVNLAIAAGMALPCQCMSMPLRPCKP